MAASPSRGVELRFLRGTWADIVTKAYVPNDGEPLWVIDKRRLNVGDGETVGGVPVAFYRTPEVFLDFLEDGSARSVTLAAAPDMDSLEVYLNGLKLHEGDENDFVVAGAVLTINYSVFQGDRLEVFSNAA